MEQFKLVASIIATVLIPALSVLFGILAKFYKDVKATKAITDKKIIDLEYKLKQEISKREKADGIILELQKENSILKDRIKVLEDENKKLKGVK